MMDTGFSITFWGVRGSIPVAQAPFMRYGGNTSCVEVTCGTRRIIFDAGTGIYALGNQLPEATSLDILLSHTHIDHIQGFPFFKPIYNKNTLVRMWAGHLLPEYRLEHVAGLIMQSPLFPLSLDSVAATIECKDFFAGDPLPDEYFLQDGITITTLPLNHPDRATAYRLSYKGKSVCYVTDIEHIPAAMNPALIAFVKGTDLLIYDCTYADETFSRYIGWGHSTWQEAVRLANAAEVASLAAFHHDPTLTDDALDVRAAALTQARPGSFVAREGQIIIL